MTVPKTRNCDTGAFVKPEEIIAWEVVRDGARAYLEVRVVEVVGCLAMTIWHVRAERS